MKSVVVPLFSILLLLAFCDAFGQRPLTIDDLMRLAEVGSPDVSADGSWVAYTVSTVDAQRDVRVTAVWMASWDGSRQIQLTQGRDSASSPKWSPDGRHLAFLREGIKKDDDREEAEDTQVWLMDRQGGEARQLTNIRGDLSDYAWSPNSQQLALVLREDEPKTAESNAETEKRPRPLVIDRYQFKSDGEGYHYRTEQSRIFLFDIHSGSLIALTDAKAFPEGDPAWSPDGSRIAFVSKRDKEWDRVENDIWVADAHANASPRQLTTFAGGDEGPLSWSPDGESIAYLQGSEPKYWLYNWYQVAVIPVQAGTPHLLTSTYDREVGPPQFTGKGRAIEFIATDDRERYLARVSITGGVVERVTTGKFTVEAKTRATLRPERVAVRSTTTSSPSEIYAVEKGRLRPLTHHNDALMATLRLALVEGIEFKAKDGVGVHGLLTKPPSWQAGRKYRTILWIHGGPHMQDEYAFDPEAQLFAANGYVVLQVNYRGSKGRGIEFGRGIFADWGDKDVSDLLSGVDWLVAQGIADPERLGVGGWSQGGVLTDYCIAHDTRFKAAMSGAGVANQLGVYGVDEYVYMYDLEFGQPWKQTERWLKLSSAFFHADRIKTPTLFMGGDKDFNVPIAGSEQMYQALQSLKVPTQLVIYPGAHHGISRPSFVRDRYERWLSWYGRYLAVARDN